MRPFLVILACVAVADVVGAAERAPSAVRARQMFGGTPFRKVQDSGGTGPQLLKPSLEPLPEDEPARGSSPTPTFDDSSDRAAPARETPFGEDPVPELNAPSNGPILQPPAGVMNGGPAPAPTSDFWIVSSRNCPQQSNGPVMQCQLEYFRCDRSGRRIPCSEGMFRQSLPRQVPVCIVVHGSFTDWNTTCEDACATQRWIRAAAPHLPVQMVFYSWPSDPATVVLPPLDVGIMGVRAEFNGLYLSQLIQRIPADSPVCFMGHSHGARAVTSCLQMLAGGSVQGYRYPNPQAIPHRIRAVYVAGAVDDQWLLPNGRYGCALRRPESLLNVRNCQDWALGFYEWRSPFAGAAMGRQGLSEFDRRTLGPTAAKVRDVDVSSILGDAHLWPAYVRRPEIATALVPSIYFEGEPGSIPAVLSPAAPVIDPASGPNPEVTRRGPASPGMTTTNRYSPSSDPNRGRVGATSPYPGAWSMPRPPIAPSNGANMVQQGTAPSPATNSFRGLPPASVGTSSPWPPRANVASPSPPASRFSAPAFPANRQAPSRSASPQGPQPSSNPATLLPPQSSTGTRPPAGGSLTPIAPVKPETLESDESETQPVHIDEAPFERPKRPLPSILRKYYPEATHTPAGSPPEV